MAMLGKDAKQYTFRLPKNLVARVEQCAERLRLSGLTVSRTDVVRLLITRGLDMTQCDPDALLASGLGERT
jgi:hypothetical protein